MTGILGVLLSVVIMPLFSLPAAAGIADAVSGLRQALTDGSGAAVKKMSVQDAKSILTGGDTAATDYFRRTRRHS